MGILFFFQEILADCIVDMRLFKLVTRISPTPWIFGWPPWTLSVELAAINPLSLISSRLYFRSFRTTTWILNSELALIWLWSWDVLPVAVSIWSKISWSRNQSTKVSFFSPKPFILIGYWPTTMVSSNMYFCLSSVGSFVWTHLTNIQESQSLSPFKQGLKVLIGSEFLQNKWNTDVRKFSRYFETSYFSDELQSGLTTDGQLIFSQNSYLPRSGMLNFTVNLFGENLNLLEVGTRMEGFEGLVSSLFGPDGTFRQDTFHQMLQTFR